MDKTDRKRLLIAEALNDLLKTRPIGQVTVVDLCEEAGISRSTFYAYFDDIYAIGEWLWEREFRSIFEGLGREYGYRECYRRLYERLREVGARVGQVRPMRDLSGGDTYAQTNTLVVLAARLEACLGRKLTPDERERLSYASCAEEAVTLKWFADGMRPDAARMADIVAEMAPQFMKDALGE